MATLDLFKLPFMTLIVNSVTQFWRGEQQFMDSHAPLIAALSASGATLCLPEMRCINPMCLQELLLLRPHGVSRFTVGA